MGSKMMDRFKMQRIQDSAQGLCGILETIYQPCVMDEVGIGPGNVMRPDTLVKLIQSAKVLSRQLNEDTEDLENHVTLKELI